MEWDKGYSATYYATAVDPQSWRDNGRFEITEGSINRENGTQSADITCTEWDVTQEKWIRIYLETRQYGGGERNALFTGLAMAPERSIDGQLIKYPLQCYSVLKPAEDVLMQRGWYAPVEVPGTQIIRQLMSVCPCPAEYADEAPALTEAIIAEDGESNLSMIRKILTAMGWRLRILGDGTVQFLPEANEPQVMFDTTRNDVVEPELSLTNDWFECPNVLRAVSEDLSAVVIDESEDSPFSTVNRGREVWMEESDCNFADGETIGDYARRRLKEEQNNYLTVSYDRRYHPDVYPSDLIRLHYPAQRIDGVFKVRSQTVSLGDGAATSEEVSNGE